MFTLLAATWSSRWSPPKTSITKAMRLIAMVFSMLAHQAMITDIRVATNNKKILFTDSGQVSTRFLVITGLRLTSTSITPEDKITKLVTRRDTTHGAASTTARMSFTTRNCTCMVMRRKPIMRNLITSPWLSMEKLMQENLNTMISTRQLCTQ